MYQVEEQARQQCAGADEVKALRQAKTKPVLAALRAAIAYSLLGSCALAGVDPWAYLKDVFEKQAGGWPQGKVFDLLPAEWAEDHPEHRLSRAARDAAPAVANQPPAQAG